MLERLSDNPKQINAVFVHKHDDYIWRKKMVGPSVGDFLCAKSSIIPDYQFMFWDFYTQTFFAVHIT